MFYLHRSLSQENILQFRIFNYLFFFKVQLAPVAYGLKKLVASCVIEDDKVSTETLEEKICEFEDYVQSVDIAAFNKI